jgi:catalase
MAEKKRLTTGFGKPVGDDQNSLTAGSPGYTLLSDVHLHDKMAHFNRERIPERVVHAKGAGAHGYFEVTDDVTRYSCAKFLDKVGKKTEVFARFSTVGGEKGSADAERDPRGFAVKFYTEEGNFDMTGNNTPVFFIRDAIKFPDFIHTQKRNPATNAKDPDAFWDFLSLTPESTHQVTILFSDRGTPLSYRHLNGYSGHALKWYTGKGDYFWVKLHFKTEQGNKTFTRQEAMEMAAKDPDHATRDLFESIKKGEFPGWKVLVQVMKPEDAGTYRYDPFDVTKVLPHGDYPLIPVGRMVLDRNPENYFAEVEQSAFCPGNLVPGFGLSPDKMLQARAVFYHDAHLHRLGPNYHLLPINAPKAATMDNYQRDGAMRTDNNLGAGPNYWPNTFSGPGPDPKVKEPETDFTGIIGRRPYPKTGDDFVQPGNLYQKVMDDTAKTNLVGNIVAHLGNAQKRIQLRQTALFFLAHKEYGTRVAESLKLDKKEVERLAGMTQEERVKATS